MARRHDFHDQESCDVENMWLSREHEQTTQKWRLKCPTHGFCISTTRHNKEKYNYVMRYCLSAHAHVLLRTIWLKHTRLVPTSSQVVHMIYTTWKKRTISL